MPELFLPDTLSLKPWLVVPDLADILRGLNITIKKSPKKEAYSACCAAFSYFEQGLYEQAIKESSRAIFLNDHFFAAFYCRGMVYSRDNGNFELALSDFNTVIRLRPKLANAYYSRGHVYAQTGRLVEAIADYEQAIRLKPDFPEALHACGNAHFAKQEYSDALAKFTKAIGLGYEDDDVFYGRGWCLIEVADELVAAIADFKAAIGLNPNHQYARRELIDACDSLKRQVFDIGTESNYSGSTHRYGSKLDHPSTEVAGPHEAGLGVAEPQEEKMVETELCIATAAKIARPKHRKAAADGMRLFLDALEAGNMKPIEALTAVASCKTTATKHPLPTDTNFSDLAKQLNERVKGRPDIVLACLKFLETDALRPEYAMLSPELAKARIERTRLQEKDRRARYRSRLREGLIPRS